VRLPAKQARQFALCLDLTLFEIADSPRRSQQPFAVADVVHEFA
jgi:hypothetical protein